MILGEDTALFIYCPQLYLGVQAGLDSLRQQLSSAEALVTMHALSHQQHQASRRSVQQEQERHAAAARAAAARMEEMEKEAAELEQGVVRRQGIMDGKEDELREAKRRLLACQVQPHWTGL
jgi:predicted nuclease with TOPRIM domain